MGFFMQIMSVIGATAKFLFRNKENKTLKQIYMQKPVGNNPLLDFDMNNAYIGLSITVILTLLIFFIHKFID